MRLQYFSSMALRGRRLEHWTFTLCYARGLVHDVVYSTRGAPRHSSHPCKLDELLHAHASARNDLSGLDDEEPEDIEKFRKGQHQKDNGPHQKDNVNRQRIGHATGRER